MQKVLRLYQKRLTNLSANNRSLLLLRLLAGQYVDIHEADFLLKNSSFYIIKQLLAQVSKIPLCAELDSRHKPSNLFSQKLKHLHRTDLHVAEECGAQDMHLGFPFVEGKLLDDTPIRCPLLLFPVQLQKQENMWFLKPRADQPLTFNKDFLLAYAHFNKVKISEELQDTDFEELSKDSIKFLTELYQLLTNSTLELDFNPETFTERLESFLPHSRAAWQQSQQQGRLKLVPQAVLGLFPQAGSYLSPDYDFLLQHTESPDIAQFFAHLRQEPQPVREEQIHGIFAQDASQEAVMRAVRGGASVVVQGPPGTGKSQVISNLIADALARNQRVLVVCQKKAALDVVFERLKSKGLERFMALVHDFRHDRKDVLAKIVTQIDALDDYTQENNALDTVFLEREYKQACRTIDRLSEDLEAFKKALFDNKACGLAPKDLYLTSEQQTAHISLDAHFKKFHFASYNNFLQTLKRFVQYAQKLDLEGYLWRNRKSFANYQLADWPNILSTLADVPSFKKRISESIGTLLGLHALPYPNCEALWLLQPEAETLRTYIQDERTFAFLKTAFPYESAQITWLEEKEKAITEGLAGVGPEVHLALPDLNAVEEAVKAYKSAQSQTFSRLYWQLFSPTQKKLVEESLLRNNLTATTESFDILLLMIQNRRTLEREVQELRQAEWLTDVPHDLRKDLFVTWFQKYKTALQAKFLLQKLLKLVPTDLNIPDRLHKPFLELIDKLYAHLAELPQKHLAWKNWLLESQIRAILNDTHKVEELSAVLQKDFDLLCEFDRLKAQIPGFELEVITLLNKHLGLYDADKMCALFDNSLRLAWLNELELQNPVLRTVSALQHSQDVEQLDASTTQKHQLNTQYMLLKAKERTYRNVQYNRQKNRSTYKDLEHQSKKKRGVWPLRKVISTFQSELFDLIPCWLASPESSSALFDMTTHFDLVIFDEASQCFAERGIPAIFRAKQVVIAGDDKQLRPSDLYTHRWDDSEALEEASVSEQTVLEVESLLDLGKQFLPEYTLLGHYRSKATALIAFSNAHFYQNRLRVIPHISTLEPQQAAIRYIKVEGTSHKSENQEEAMEVLRLVKSLIYSGKKDIGIITFNYKQQELIADLLDLTEMALPPQLFVKNIENVQGDERDIIIFSVGYAPTEKGRFEAKFGSLNLEGGENRLNVAISRAKEQIYVVSSIWPHELQVEQTLNHGPKLLKAYLQYAHAVSEGERNFGAPSNNNQPSTSLFLWQKIQAAWQNSHFELLQQWPFADLTLQAEQQKPVGLILTDDALYYKSLSAKDAHVYIPALLREKGWPLQVAHSRNFWLNAQEELNNLKVWASSLS